MKEKKNLAASVRDRLRQEGVDNKLGEVNRFSTVADVVDSLQRAERIG